MEPTPAPIIKVAEISSGFICRSDRMGTMRTPITAAAAMESLSRAPALARATMILAIRPLGDCAKIARSDSNTIVMVPIRT